MSWLGAAAARRSTDRHPYYPRDVAIPHYQPNSTALPVLLGSFGGMLFVIVAASLILATRARRGLNRTDLALIGWFVLCGTLHCFFEGYFVLNHGRLASSQSPLAQVWKEYALSDSRYLTTDPFTLCVEAVTVLFWGPLSYYTAICIMRGSNLRYPLQVIVSLAHLYGVALYYSTCYAEQFYRGVSYSRPETLYFWGYYVGFNAPWVVVPAAILFSSTSRIRRVFDAFERMNVALVVGLENHESVESKKKR